MFNSASFTLISVDDLTIDVEINVLVSTFQPKGKVYFKFFEKKNDLQIVFVKRFKMIDINNDC